MAKVIHQVGADVIAVQEIENGQVLEDLRQKVQGRGTDYPHTWMSDGTEPASVRPEATRGSMRPSRV